jgi:hypothetical protein
MAKTCLAYTRDVECMDSEMNSTINYIKACRQYYLPYHAFNEVYRNVYCALCESNAGILYIQYNKKEGKTGIDTTLPSFSALLDFETIDKEPVVSEMKCAANQIFDKNLVSYIKLFLCFSLFCSACRYM